MPSADERGSVRSHGSAVHRRTPPGRTAALVVALLALGAVTVTYLAGDPANESERSAITSPDVEDPPPIATNDLGDVIPDPPIPDPLDERVTGFGGDLRLIVFSNEGMERWRWTSGPDGVLEKSPAEPDLYGAAFDASGDLVAAIRRYGREAPSLRVAAPRTEMAPVFWGAESFAWHRTVTGGIAWVSQSPTQEWATLHAGAWVRDGVYFKPVTTLIGVDVRATSPTSSRLVGYDDHGYLFERWERRDGEAHVSVVRYTPDGAETAEAEGAFIGFIPDGRIALGLDRQTFLIDPVDLQADEILAAGYTSIAATADGRLAATDSESTTVDLIDGKAVRTVDIGQLRPVALAWGPRQRFAIVAGHADDEPVLVFIDAATLDTTTLFVGGHVAAVSP